MKKTYTFYRKADIPKAKAVENLTRRFPSADIVSFVEKVASPQEARVAGTKPGAKVYEAKVRIAQGDLGNRNVEGEGVPKPSKPRPKLRPKPKFPGKDSPGKGRTLLNEDAEEDDPEDVSALVTQEKDVKPEPKFDSPAGEPEDSEMGGNEKIIHLLEQILDAIKNGGLDDSKPEEEDLTESPEDVVLPDIGAPEKGEALPPPAPARGGPARPGGGAVPPPARPRNVGAPAAFSKFDPRRKKVVLVREDVNDSITTTALRQEAEELFPTHKVARIRRRGEEIINGSKVNLPEAGLAVVTLVKR